MDESPSMAESPLPSTDDVYPAPVRPVNLAFQLAIAVASLAIWLAFLPSVQLLLPLQLGALLQ